MPVAVNLQQWTDLAQVVVAVFTVAGVIGTAFLSVRALREVQRDRVLRQAPYLAFDSGGYRLHVTFVKAGAAIPGVNPEWVARMLPNLPADAESVRLEKPQGGVQFYGHLHNLGAGSATDTEVIWEPAAVVVGQERFHIDAAKRAEPIYAAALNTMPLSPRLLKPGDTAELSRLPTFIEKDFEKKITRVDGLLHITCRDTARLGYEFLQEFHMFTGYAETPPWVHVTFGDVVDPVAHATKAARHNLLTGRARQNELPP